MYLAEPSDEQKLEAVWAYIDHAFSTPVTDSDSQPDYVPTQIISELFKREGFDGVVYKSLVAEGYNVALFDRECVELRSCHLFEARKMAIEFTESGNPYFTVPHDKS